MSVGMCGCGREKHIGKERERKKYRDRVYSFSITPVCVKRKYILYVCICVYMYIGIPMRILYHTCVCAMYSILLYFIL